MQYLNIINYTLNSTSLLITCLILIVSFIGKLQKRFLNELMTYILISELINALSKYLSFIWNKCWESKSDSKRVCAMITPSGNIQIYLHIFADILSMASNVAISFYTYDILKNKSNILNNRRSKNTIRFFIFIFAVLISTTVGTIQIVYYQFYPKRDFSFINRGRCAIVSCNLAADLDLIIIGIIFGSSISTILISFLNCKLLKSESIRLTKDKHRQGKQELLTQINQAQWKIMLFPIVSSILFILYYIDSFIKDIFADSFLNNDRLKTDTGFVYSFANGLRGTLFSLLIFFTYSDITKIICNFFNWIKQKQTMEVNDQNKWV